ncbi:MAG: TlyA family RNA methyltransferase [Erysipelotrichaceae bacterium]|nr:TlyA family RNA methyltransferase [Erysipelotrichaceae bacterium]
MRLDQYLVQQQLFETRNRAQEAIKDGLITINGKQIVKPGYQVSEHDEIQMIQTTRYVSRSGEKLAGALQQFQIDVSNLVALDIGASTGGFTDCLLQYGAKYVYAVDVGQDQLVPSLRNRVDVECREQVNCRYLEKEDFEKPIELVVMDVSFISCTKLMESISKVLLDKHGCIILIKPQFEVGKQYLSKHGIVTNQNEVWKSIQFCIDTAKGYQLELQDIMYSSVKGKEGNQEFLAYFIKCGAHLQLDWKQKLKQR